MIWTSDLRRPTMTHPLMEVPKLTTCYTIQAASQNSDVNTTGTSPGIYESFTDSADGYIVIGVDRLKKSAHYRESFLGYPTLRNGHMSAGALLRAQQHNYKFASPTPNITIRELRNNNSGTAFLRSFTPIQGTHHSLFFQNIFKSLFLRNTTLLTSGRCKVCPWEK